MNTTVRRRPVRRSFDPFWTNVFDDLFNTTLGDVVRGSDRKTVPATNIYEQDDQFVIELAVPGIPKDQITISVEEDVLTISAKKAESSDEAAKPNYRLREFDYSAFSKTYRLSEVVDTEKIDARAENGILTIVLSKKEEAKPLPAKTVEIK